MAQITFSMTDTPQTIPDLVSGTTYLGQNLTNQIIRIHSGPDTTADEDVTTGIVVQTYETFTLTPQDDEAIWAWVQREGGTGTIIYEEVI